MLKCWLLLTMLALTGSPDAQEISVPERPADHLLDQTGRVTAEQRAVLKEALIAGEKKTALGIYVVLLNAVPEEPPGDLARRLADNWKGSADRAVIVVGPGTPMVIAVSGESLGAAPEASISGLIGAATSAANGIEPPIEAARAAGKSLFDQLTIWRAGGPLGPPPAAPKEAPPETGNHLMAWIAGGSLVCCLTALVLMRRGRRSALIFPQVEFRHRFSAPHSGGNDAVVYFTRRDS